MKQSTLCFCIKNDEVLLGMKRRGFGIGKWNGYGGKVEKDETAEAGAIRELREESGLIAQNTEQVALIRFYFDETPVFECSVFVIRDWTGEAIETEEMTPHWYKIHELPLQNMWAADGKWLPLILAGETIEAEVRFNADGSALKEFHFKPRNFSKENKEIAIR